MAQAADLGGGKSCEEEGQEGHTSFPNRTLPYSLGCCLSRTLEQFSFHGFSLDKEDSSPGQVRESSY